MADPAGGVAVSLGPAAFVRVAAGHPSWLAALRWPPEALARLDDLGRSATRLDELTTAVERHRPGFSIGEWSTLLTWLERAPQRSSGTPRLLDRLPSARKDFVELAQARREHQRRSTRAATLLEDHVQQLYEAALGMAREPGPAAILAYASRDLVHALAAAGDGSGGSGGSRKDRRNLARAIGSQLARSVYKSAPLGCAAGTAALLLAPGSTRTSLTGHPELLAVMRLNQNLCNQIIALWRPLREYLDGGRSLRLSVTASWEGERVLWWRSERRGETVRESLAALRLPVWADTALGTPGTVPVGAERLAELGLLVRDDLVTPATGDPWRLLDAVAAANGADTHRSVAYRRARQLIGAFRFPRVVGTGTGVVAGLRAATDLAAEVGEGGRHASSAVSLDTYRLLDGAISGNDLSTIRHAVRQYLLAGALAYSRSPSHRNRQRLVEHFRTTYGDDSQVPLQQVLVRDWDLIEDIVSFLLSPTNPPVHPANDLVWPEPSGSPDAYTALFARLQAAAASQLHEVHLPPLNHATPVLARAQPVVDLVCRLGRAPGCEPLDVVVESATLWGRLTDRHQEALDALHERAHRVSPHTAWPPPPLGHRRVIVLASPANPRLQNLSRVDWDGGTVLALSDPIPPEMKQPVRYSDLSVRYDSRGDEFVVTGPDGLPLEFVWPSPLSPAFSRRLHFLRYLTLTGRPVIAAPRWMPHEAQHGGHLPRLRLGPLVLSPERWSVPLASFRPVLGSGSRATMFTRLRSLQHWLGLPDEVFVYSCADTRPAFVDLAAPWGAEALVHQLRRATSQAAATMLFEECYPALADSLGDGPGSWSFVFRAHLETEPSTQAPAGR